jgi:hypothetical protein
VEAEAPGELGDTGLALTVAEGEEERGGTINRSDRIPVKNHRRAPS